MTARFKSYATIPVSELYLALLDQIWNNHILRGKETSSLKSYRMEKERRSYSNRPQPCNGDEMY